MRDFTTIRVSRRLLEELKSLGRKGETYEQILWRLVEYWRRTGQQ